MVPEYILEYFQPLYSLLLSDHRISRNLDPGRDPGAAPYYRGQITDKDVHSDCQRIITLLERVSAVHGIPHIVRPYDQVSFAYAHPFGLTSQYGYKYWWPESWAGLKDADNAFRRSKGLYLSKHPRYHQRYYEHVVSRYLHENVSTIAEVKQEFSDNWDQYRQNLLQLRGELRRLGFDFESREAVANELLPHATRYRYKMHLERRITHPRGLLTIRKDGEPVFLHDIKDAELTLPDFVGEILFGGPAFLAKCVQRGMKRYLREINQHQRIVDMLQETGMFEELETNVRIESYQIDIVARGGPFPPASSDAVFVLEVKPTLVHSAIGQVEWYRHLYSESHSSETVYPGIVCRAISDDVLLRYCQHKGIAVFVMDYGKAEVYEPVEVQQRPNS